MRIGISRPFLCICILTLQNPVSRKQCGEIFWSGGTSSGHNRWFDKSIQLISTTNGKTGLLGEHSMMDGMPMIGLADHITKTSYRDAQNKPYSSYQNDIYAEIEDIFEGVNLGASANECIEKG